MGEKKQLNVRIPLELQEEIEKSGRSKVDIVIEALELYFNSKKPKEALKEEIQAESPASPGSVSKLPPVESDEMNRMKKEVDFLRTKIDDLLKLLHQEQVLHIQTQRMLSPPQPETKKWWQFWA
ncbi:MAG: hypothetical protein OIN86_06535 [Candidatus Methanoperedens sp.]|nr:hypothetical protein [Candidatus Methanoperedens sp.]CAG0955452.1 hypothetical protein METP1_00421 [Methanosarcinales archaeon]